MRSLSCAGSPSSDPTPGTAPCGSRGAGSALLQWRAALGLFAHVCTRLGELSTDPIPALGEGMVQKSTKEHPWPWVPPTPSPIPLFSPQPGRAAPIPWPLIPEHLKATPVTSRYCPSSPQNCPYLQNCPSTPELPLCPSELCPSPLTATPSSQNCSHTPYLPPPLPCYPSVLPPHTPQGHPLTPELPLTPLRAAHTHQNCPSHQPLSPQISHLFRSAPQKCPSPLRTTPSPLRAAHTSQSHP